MRNRSRWGLFAAFLTIAPALAFGLSPAPASAEVVLLVGSSNTVAVAKGLRHFETQHPQAAALLRARLVGEADLEELRRTNAEEVRVLLLDVHSPAITDKLMKEQKAALIRRVAARGKVLVLGESLAAHSTFTSVGAAYDDRVRAYWAAGGWRNVYGLLCLLAGAELGQQVPVPAVEPAPVEGYYHPDAPGQRWFPTFDAYRQWHARARPAAAGRAWVAVPFYGSSLHDDQTAVLDAVVRELERQGMNALPMFGYPARRVWEKLLLDERGQARAQAALAFNFRFAGPETQEWMLKAGIPVMNLVKVFGRSEEDWRQSKTGLSIFEGVFQIFVPEISGLVAPIVVGTEEKRYDAELRATVVTARPVPERVAMAVRRIGRYLRLQTRPNAQKRLALLYYNYPPGKANIGASYLNSLRSIARMLERLKKEGYDVGVGPLTEEEVTRRALAGGRNVGSYAPGELEAMVREGQVTLVPRARYEAWFAGLPEAFRTRVTKDWGVPDVGEGMWIKRGQGLDMVVPVAVYGNVAVLPQPDRGFGQDLTKLYHSMDVTPPHHYAGVYRWLRDEWKADAVVHVGTHGTLEWLSGKTMGLTESDAPDVMIDELPNVYVYNVDVVGEGLVAKRRGMASLVDHMIPPLRKGGLYGEYARIYELINDHDAAATKDERLAAAYADELRVKLAERGLLKDLGLEGGKGRFTHAEVHRIQDYFIDLKNKNMPYGLHTFGEAPEASLRQSTVAAILEPDRGWNPLRRAAMARELEQRIVDSGRRELDQWVAALAGRYLPVGTGNDPIRNPDSLPTGKNFYGIDPTKVPKKAAWDLGVRLADQMIRDHLKRHRQYPRKVAFVIWGGETLRNEGVTESQFFHLLGTRPVWDARGKVVDVEVIPRSKLGRPRIDVVVSSAAEGMFGQLTQLMDEAVQKVNLLEEPQNYARDHTLANARRLAGKGHDQKEALRRASVRIFDEPPGQYNLNVSRIIQNSGSWDKETAASNDYFQKMGHGYGNGSWGEKMEDAFRLTLSGTETVVHSASSNLYGALDNDDFFMYAGGLVQAVRHLDGTHPELMVTDMQNVGRERMTPIGRFMGMEFRNRQTNPLWIRGMMKEGYAGAHEMRAHLENLWGWQVTVPQAVGAEKWSEVYETYVLDRNRLGLDGYFQQHSPFARQDMVARMLETIRKGYWSPGAEVRKRLASEYVRGAAAHGPSCASFVCQNPGLTTFAVAEARAAGVADAELQTFQTRIEQATGKKLDDARAETRRFVAQTESRHAARAAEVQAGPGKPGPLKGLVMEKQATDPSAAKQRTSADRNHLETLAASLLSVVLAGGGWWWMRRRRRVA